jgi:hypothetical protein
MSGLRPRGQFQLTTDKKHYAIAYEHLMSCHVNPVRMHTAENQRFTHELREKGVEAFF